MQQRQRALPSGSGLFGVPTTWWVAAELVVVGLLFLVLGNGMAFRVLGVLMIAGAALVVPWRGRAPLAAFASRATFAPERPAPVRPGPTDEAAPQPWDEIAPDEHLVPAAEPPWRTVFPGVELVDAHDARGRSCGAVGFEGLTSLCFSVTPGQDVQGMALAALCDHLVEARVPVHSVAWAMRPPVLTAPTELAGALQRQAISAGYAVQWPAEVSVRFTTQQLDVAAAMRGGESEGRAAALTSAATTVVRALGASGWTARVLDAEAISLDVARSLGSDPTRMPRWSETWNDVVVAEQHHRGLTLTTWADGLQLVEVVGSVADVVVEFTVEAFDLAGDRPVRLLARVHGPDTDAVAAAVRGMTARGRHSSSSPNTTSTPSTTSSPQNTPRTQDTPSTRKAGRTSRTARHSEWSVLDGRHLTALRATTLVGEGHE